MSYYHSPEVPDLMQRVEALIANASNRYKIVVQISSRAKRRRYEDFDNPEESALKPVIRAIVEMSDELTQPDLIGGN